MSGKAIQDQVEALLLAVEVDEGIVQMIASLGADARKHLLALLGPEVRDSKPQLAKRAALVAGALRLEDAVPVLKEWTRLPDESMAASGLHALARADERSACRAALELVKDPARPPTVKGHALLVLGLVGDHEASSGLESWTLENGDPDLERTARPVIAKLKRRLAGSTN